MSIIFKITIWYNPNKLGKEPRIVRKDTNRKQKDTKAQNVKKFKLCTQERWE